MKDNSSHGYLLFLSTQYYRLDLFGTIKRLREVMGFVSAAVFLPLPVNASSYLAVRNFTHLPLMQSQENSTVLQWVMPFANVGFQNTLTLADVRMKRSHYGFDELNIGGAYRMQTASLDWLGLVAFVDYMRWPESMQGLRGKKGFWQATVGGEWLSETKFARCNGYFPQQKEITLESNFVLDENTNNLALKTTKALADYGVDFDFGPRFKRYGSVTNIAFGAGVFGHNGYPIRSLTRLTVSHTHQQGIGGLPLDTSFRIQRDNTGSWSLQLGLGLRLYAREQSLHTKLMPQYAPIDRDLNVVTRQVTQTEPLFALHQSEHSSKQLGDNMSMPYAHTDHGPLQTPQIAELLVPPTHAFYAPLVFSSEGDEITMFPHPLGVRFKNGVLELGSTREVLGLTDDSSTVYAAIANTLIGDVRISAPGFKQHYVNNYSEFSVDVGFRSDSTALVTLTQGSPYIFVQNPKAQVIRMELGAGASVKPCTDPRQRLLEIAGGDRKYLLSVVDEGALTQSQDALELTSTFISIAAVPKEATLGDLDTLKRNAFHKVVGTSTEQNGAVTEFRVQAEDVVTGRRDVSTVLALYPHQSQHLADSKPLMSSFYPSIRGALYALEGTGFSTYTQLPQALPYLPAVNLEESEKTLLRTLLVKELARYETRLANAQEPLTDAKDTYWLGKALHVLCEQVHVAHALGDVATRDALLRVQKHELDNWFQGRGEKRFVYNPTWGVVLGLPASFGSDKDLNDLHFHLGYFIEASSTVALYDRAWALSREKYVDALVHSLINYDDNPLFMHTPHRLFRPYAGFSQASGYARFGDGGNHESSSEAMNAWSSTLLWAHALENKKLIPRARQAFATESQSIWTYYFNTNPATQAAFKDVNPRYEKPAVGMVWDNKYDWATWFSADPAHIYGIQLLPISARSLYLAQDLEFVNSDRVRFVTESATSWQDLFAMMHTMSDGKPRQITSNLEAGNSEVAFAYWNTAFSHLGAVHPSITSEHAFSAVFENNMGVRTYTAYNPTQRVVDVVFSDGVKVSHIEPASQKYLQIQG